MLRATCGGATITWSARWALREEEMGEQGPRLLSISEPDFRGVIFATWLARDGRPNGGMLLCMPLRDFELMSPDDQVRIEDAVARDTVPCRIAADVPNLSTRFRSPRDPIIAAEAVIDNVRHGGRTGGERFRPLSRADAIAEIMRQPADAPARQLLQRAGIRR